MKKSEFVRRYFDEPVGNNRCFLVEKRGKRLGSFLIRSYQDRHLMYDRLECRETRVFEEIMGSIRSLTEIEGVISLFPDFGREDYFEDWERVGFTADERAPYHILMKKELLEEKDHVEMEAEVEVLQSAEQKDLVEALAYVIVEISDRFDDKMDIREELGWELEGDINYYLALKGGKTVGYSGVEVRDLFTGETMYWIRELGVHPYERRKGIATYLLRYTIDQVKEKGGKEVYIDTHSKNPAKDLYEKLDFQVIEGLPDLRYET